MKRLWIGLFAGSLAIVVAAYQGWTQPPGGVAPGPKGAVLQQAWDAPPSVPGGVPGQSNGNYIQSTFLGQGAPGAVAQLPGGMSGMDDFRLPEWKEYPDPNKDVAVTPAQGAWMITIIAYQGENAPLSARKMVIELREHFKLPAYVYNHGAAERKKEYDRVVEVMVKQREELKKNFGGMKVAWRRPHTVHIDEQVAVLVGGYPEAPPPEGGPSTQAKRALDSIRSIKPDPKVFSSRVDLDTKFYVKDPNNIRPDEEGNAERVYVNPFQRAFLTRNPTIRTERNADWDKFERPVLATLNRSEPYSLLKCPRPVTLVIKRFSTPASLEQRSVKGNFLSSLGLGVLGSKAPDIDAAATNAHNFADTLRKLGLDAYVLHTPRSSIVTVGAFDGLDDPSLQTMQRMLEARLQQVDAAIARQVGAGASLGLLPTPLPWEFQKSITGGG